MLSILGNTKPQTWTLWTSDISLPSWRREQGRTAADMPKYSTCSQFPLLLLLCTSHNKELTEIKTCCKQLKCTPYFTRTSGRPESGALLCGCNLNAASVTSDFFTLQLQEKSACFYSYLFWEVDLNVELLLLCTHIMELQYIYIYFNAVFKCCTFYILKSILMAWFPLDGTKAFKRFQNGILAH